MEKLKYFKAQLQLLDRESEETTLKQSSQHFQWNQVVSNLLKADKPTFTGSSPRFWNASASNHDCFQSTPKDRKRRGNFRSFLNILSILSTYSNKNLEQTYHLLHFVSTRSFIAKFLRRGKRENLSVVQSKLTHCKSRTKVISCTKTS